MPTEPPTTPRGGTSARPQGLVPGTRVGNVVVEREIGRGGCAVVHLARDVLVDRPVALKVVDAPGGSGHGDDGDAADARRAVLSEARVVAALGGAHVVTLYGVHQLADGRLAFEMEYLEGGSLRERLGGDPLDPEQATRFLRGILRGLSVAHARGVLHRDVKPANVLLAADGAVKLADFGIARMRGEDTFLTDQGVAVAGTPWYMAPETLLGEAPSPQTDLWSVGVVAFEMLSGRVPFEAPDLPGLFATVQNAPAPALPATVPPRLAQVVARCLAKRREDRPASADEVLRLLDPPARETAGRVAERAEYAPLRAAPIRREAEAAAILDALDRSAGGEPVVALVTGDEGIGKTALLADVAGRARGRGYTWIGVTASPVDGTVAAMLAAVRRELTRRDRRPRADETEEAAITRLLDGGPTIERRDQALWALDHGLRALADAAPVALVVDDAQHLEGPDVEVLAGLARRLRGRRFGLVAASRSDDGTVPAALTALPDVRRIPLGGLPREDVYAWIEQVAGAEVAPVVAARISERSDGNPAVAAEILRHLEATGAVTRHGGRVEPVPGWDAHPLPSRLREVFESRLAHLGDDERHLLEAAAVDGRDFDGRALADALSLPLLDVLRTLQRFCRAHLLQPTATGYRFASPVIHAVLVESLSPEIRTEYHRALARALGPRKDDVDPERMARHLAGAGDTAAAEEFFARAADRAGDALRPDRALALAERAGLLAEDVPFDRVVRHATLVLRLAGHASDAGRHDVADRLRSRLRAAAEAAGNADLVLWADVWRDHDRIAARGTTGLDEEMLRRATTLPDGVVPCDAWRCLGMLAKRRGDEDAAEHAFRESLRIARANGYELQHASALDQLGSVERRRGRFAEAVKAYRRAAALAERIGSRRLAGTSHFNVAAATIQSGAIDGVETVLQRSIHLFELDGFAQGAAHARAALAEVLFALGDVAGAETAGRRAIETLRTLGHPPGLAMAQNCMGELLAVEGRTDEALAMLADARDSARRAGERILEASATANTCLAHCLAGRRDEAAQAADAVLALTSGGTQAVAEILVRLGVTGYLGLPADAIRAARAAAETALDGPHTPAARAVLAGAEAFVDPSGSSDLLRAAAAAMRDPRVAVRRSVYGPLAAWVDAAALARDGATTGARDVARLAIRDLRESGLTALEAAVTRFAEGLPGWTGVGT